MRALLVILFSLTLGGVAGCGVDCIEDRQVVEIFTQFRSLGEAILEAHQANGYDCDFDGSMLNAVGGVVGSRYVCTKCV